MPTYEYACQSCGNRYEMREGFDAPARQKCPKCGKLAMRVIFAPPIVFKGGGFYKTDSRGSAPTESASSTGTAKPSTEATTAADGHGHTHGAGGHTHGSTDGATEPAAAT